MRDGRHVDERMSGCRVEALTVSAPVVCVRAREHHLPFWTGKAASAAAERSSDHELQRGRARERTIDEGRAEL